MKKKRYFPVFFTLLLIFTLAANPISALALPGDTGTTADGFSWLELTDGTVAVTGYSGADIDVVIPGIMDSKSVSAIGGNAFNGETTLNSVVIPGGVNTIGDNAFDGCTGITSITIPGSVTAIGQGAFQNCASLTGVTIPNGVGVISDYTFNQCGDLSSVTLPAGLSTIGAYGFGDCDSLTGITIPNNVTSIGTGAFRNCDNLAGITIPNGVGVIEADTFRECTWLASVTLPAGLTAIGDNAFTDCTGLAGVTLPGGLTSIGTGAFSNCTGMTVFTVPVGITAINTDTFNGCTGLASVALPAGLTTIGANAFMDCSGLNNMTLPDHVTAIGQSAFQNCSSLAEVTIPEGMASIGNDAFRDCGGLSKATVLSRTVSLGTDLFDASNIISDGMYVLESSTAHTYAIGVPHPYHLLREVIFDSQGGTPVNGVFPENGDTIGVPSGPYRSGYIFDGWYRESLCINRWDFPTDTVTVDYTTLYAKWNTLPHDGSGEVTVTFDSRGGNAEPSQKVERNTVVQTPDPVREGYIFGGWYADSSYKEVWDMAAGRRDMTVYAKWYLPVSLYTGGRVTVTPDTSGGTWAWDAAYVSLTQKADGAVTVTGLKTGTTDIAYTLNGDMTAYRVTIRTAALPATGQAYRPVYITLASALGAFMIAMMTRRRRHRRQNA